MFDLQDFTLTQMIQVGANLRKLGEGAESMEEASGRIVRYLYDNLTSGHTNHRACVLVRVFKTHPFGELDDRLRQCATAGLRGAVATPTMKCLTLLATAGEKPEWNSRTKSEGHQAIPLASASAIENSPMISQLLSELGVSFSTLLKPDPALMLDAGHAGFNVFHVAEAKGSPYVPAQREFVIPYGVQSVLGFGGLLPTGNLFAVILFSKVHVPRESADLFKTLALSTKLALIPFVEDRVFSRTPA